MSKVDLTVSKVDPTVSKVDPDSKQSGPCQLAKWTPTVSKVDPDSAFWNHGPYRTFKFKLQRSVVKNLSKQVFKRKMSVF